MDYKRLMKNYLYLLFCSIIMTLIFGYVYINHFFSFIVLIGFTCSFSSTIELISLIIITHKENKKQQTCLHKVYYNNTNRQLECLLSEEVRCCAKGLMPCEFYKGLAFTTIWLENADSQKKMPEALFYTGSFFLTKLHESNSRGLAQQEKRETDHNL